MNRQCKFANKETDALADALSKKFPVDRGTILAKIESWQIAYDQSGDTMPTVALMTSFLESQRAGQPFRISMEFAQQLKEMMANREVAYIPDKKLFITPTGTIIDSKGNILSYDENSSEYDDLMQRALEQLGLETTTKVEGGRYSDNSLRTSNVIVVNEGNWTREQVKNDPNNLYIFTDNTDRDSGKSLIPDDSKYAQRYGKGKHFPTVTAAVIRGLDNAFPISTLRWYHEGAKGEYGRWKDEDAEEFERVISEEIDVIIEEWNTGNYLSIVIPSGDGFFNSRISNISKERTPKLYAILQLQLARLENAVGGRLASAEKISKTEKISSKEKPVLQTDEIKELIVIEDQSRRYLDRTLANADYGDITLALALNYNTAGEKQTAEAAGAEMEKATKQDGTTYNYAIKREAGKYVQFPIEDEDNVEEIANRVVLSIKDRGLKTEDIILNVAGNGLSNLNISQEQADLYVLKVIQRLLDLGITISEIRSGGLTGIDEAGIKAALKLGIKASILAPKGYKFRNKDGKDVSDKVAFMLRFNPNYKESKQDSKREASKEKRKSGSTVIWEDERIKKERERVFEAAKAFRLNTLKMFGAASAWANTAMRYGIIDDRLIKAEEATYLGLTPDERKLLNNKYHLAMVALKRPEINLNWNGTSDKTKRDGRLHRLLYKQVHESDGVFLIGLIVNPGETSHSAFEGAKAWENKATFLALAGANGIAAYHAIQEGKPVYVFDEYRGGWFTWDNAKKEFILTETPILTKNAFCFGKEGNKTAPTRRYSDTLGKENYNAIREVFEKTFGISLAGRDYYVSSDSGLSPEELGEGMQLIALAASEHETSIEDMQVNKEGNQVARLLLDMNPLQRQYRAEMLSHMFSDAIDLLIDEDISGELDVKIILTEASLAKAIALLDKEAINSLRKKRDVLKKYYRTLQSSSSDDLNARKAAIKAHGLDEIFEKIRQQLQEMLDDEENPTKVDALQKTLDNFQVLILDAMEKVQEFENFRLIPFKRKGSSKLEGEVTDSLADQEASEEAMYDDEEGTRMTGNDGWSFKIRFVDPRFSLSLLTKKALSSIVMLDDDGNELRDDLGNIRFMNGEFAHAMLISELSEMIDADDFCEKIGEDEYGEPIFRFPALLKILSKYPWVKNLITKLENDNNLVGAFFHDFNKSFISYYTVDENGKPMALNAPISLSAALDELIRNVTNLQILTGESVYNTNGVDRENAKALQDKLKNLDKLALRVNMQDLLTLDKISQELTFILESLGFNADNKFIRNNLPIILEKQKGEGTLYRTLSNNIGVILQLIANPEGTKKRKFKDTDDYILFFRPELKSISKIIGKITELDNIQSFKDGTKNRYSYSAPNYAINLIKKIKNNERRAKFLMDEFGYDDWFYRNGEWQNEWLKILSSESQESKYLRLALELTEVISIMDERAEDGTRSYADWNKLQTYEVLLGQYWALGTTDSGILLARYNFPMFSDSPANMFITMIRYTSDSEGTFKEKLLPLLANVVKQELRRIKAIGDRKKAGASRILNYDDNGGKYNFFPELNSLRTLPDENGNTLEYKVLFQLALDAKDMKELDRLINEALNIIMTKLFQEFLSDLAPNNNLADKMASWKAFKKVQAKDGITRELADQKNFNSMVNALEEYFWNSVFATSQIIQLTTSDLAFYKNPVDFQKRFKEVYAAGNRLNTNSKYGRKLENAIYIADHIITSSRYSTSKTLLQSAVAAGRMTDVLMKGILDKLKDINVADAQAFRNPYAFRAVLDMMGRWNDEMEESFLRLINNEWDDKDISIIWLTIKPFMFTNIPVDNGLGGRIRVPHQNKNSEFLVLAFYDMISAGLKDSKFLKGIGLFFAAHPEIDLILFESAVKAGGLGILDLNYNSAKAEALVDKHNLREAVKLAGKNPDFMPIIDILKIGADYKLDNGELTLELYNAIMEEVEPEAEDLANYLEEAIKGDGGEYNMEEGNFNREIIHLLPYADYMIALPTPEHLMDEENATSGSLFRNLILANLSDLFTINLTIKGRKITLNKRLIMDLYRGAIVNNLLDSFENLEHNMFKDIHSLQQHLLKTIQGNPKYGLDVIDALLIITVEDPTEPGSTMEVFNLPLDLPTISNLVQELLTSVFKNHVTKQTINGGNCILVACVGLSRKLNIERDENGVIKYAECMLPAWSQTFFEPFMVTKYKEVNGRKVEYKELDIEKVKETSPELLNIVGYRIPTENKYSMLPLRVVGFLPQLNGSAIMLPADITLLAGSDFDKHNVEVKLC